MYIGRCSSCAVDRRVAHSPPRCAQRFQSDAINRPVHFYCSIGTLYVYVYTQVAAADNMRGAHTAPGPMAFSQSTISLLDAHEYTHTHTQYTRARAPIILAHERTSASIVLSLVIYRRKSLTLIHAIYTRVYMLWYIPRMIRESRRIYAHYTLLHARAGLLLLDKLLSDNLLTSKFIYERKPTTTIHLSRCGYFIDRLPLTPCDRIITYQ